MARSDKVAAVAELANKFSSSAGVVLTEYRGLSVKALKELRRSLGEDASYSVSKNTLTTIAAREAGIDVIEEHLAGPTAIAFIDGDPVVVAKGLRAGMSLGCSSATFTAPSQAGGPGIGVTAQQR